MSGDLVRRRDAVRRRGRSTTIVPPLTAAEPPPERAKHHGGAPPDDGDERRGSTARASGQRRGALVSGTSPSAAVASSTSAVAVGWRSSRSFAIARASTSSTAVRQPRPALARGRRLLVEVGVDDRDLGDAGERDGARERLEEQAAERVDVGAPVDLLAADLLRGDVVDRAHQAAVGGLAVGGALREPEVGEVDVLAPALLVDEDVRRLHVAVDEPERVRGVERVRDLRRDRDRASRLERALAAAAAPSGRCRRRTASR